MSPEIQVALPHEQRALLLSLRPRFAQGIIDGTKTIELRRRAPDCAPGTQVLLYSSTPVRAIVGTAVLGRTHSEHPDKIWRTFGARSSVSREEFDDYFEGNTVAHAIEIASASGVPRPLPIADMRDTFDLQPPQSWRYLPAVQAEILTDYLHPPSAHGASPDIDTARIGHSGTVSSVLRLPRVFLGMRKGVRK